MRDYKFRAWNHEERIMGYYEVMDACDGSMLSCGEKTFVDDDGELYHCGSYKSWQNCESITQYTGLEDKNGIEIYEGDIVKIYGKYKNPKCFEVYFDDGCFMLKNKAISKYKNIEVVGNVFQNME